jgi:kynurenine 3-monooxygenase
MLKIVGAGPVGSLLAIYLAQRGHDVEVFERRADMRRETVEAGRSINLALSVRGIHALKEVGLDRAALEQAIPMRGRMMHSPTGELTFQPYGKDDSDCIYSISRGGLNQLLMSAAEKTGKAKIHFNRKLESVDLEAGKLRFSDDDVDAKLVIGADGSASVLRDAIAQRENRSEYLDYGYKELALPAGAGGTYQLEKNALHIWPRGTYMLIALPNSDGSFTCTLFLPFEGEVSFATLKTPADVKKFFEAHFADVAARFPLLTEEFFANPTGRMVTVHAQPWFGEGSGMSVGLVGDAAHAIVPFFGQGMNCGFEDCTVLNQLLAKKPDWRECLQEFSETRKADADAIAEMAVENFAEMRDKVADPAFLLEKQVERVLQREFPSHYVSRYVQVTFSRVPYRQALAAGLVHQKILGELCRGLSKPEDLDLARAKKLVFEQLKTTN